MKAVRLIVLGAVIMLLGVGAAFHAKQGMRGSGGLARGLVFAAGVAGLFGGRHVFNTGRRIRAAAAHEVDARAPVVYLRAFDDDAGQAEVPGALLTLVVKTREEQLATVLREIGPVLAIGRPGEPLPPLGAARHYVGDGGDWQTVVRQLMTRARLVVLRVGATPGLLWEFRTALADLAPERLLLVLPDDRSIYATFRAGTQGVLPTALPPLPEAWSPLRRLGALYGAPAGYLRFDTGWVAQWLPVDPNWQHVWRGRWHPWEASIQRALAPVAASLGIAWRGPGVNWAVLGAVVVAVTIGMCYT